MNAERRKRINAIKNQIEPLVSQLGVDIREELEAIRDEEQEAYDNLPEQFQEGEKGEAMQEAIERLEEVIGMLEDPLPKYAELLEDAVA